MSPESPISASKLFPLQLATLISNRQVADTKSLQSIGCNDVHLVNVLLKAQHPLWQFASLILRTFLSGCKGIGIFV